MDIGFPKGPEDISPAQLTAALRVGEVGSFTAEPIGVGVGILALLWRLTITWAADRAGPPLPATVVLKLPHTMGESRFIADAFKFYRREVRFFEQLAARTPVSTPAVYYSSFDDASGDFVLLMEDLGDQRMCDQVAGCSGDDATAVIEAIARHHAAFWDDPSLVAMDWTCRIIDPPNPQALGPALQASWPIIESQFADLLPGELFDAARRMPDSIVSLMDALSEPPLTLLHGDVRLDNVFFSGDGSVSLIDWQICGLGRGPYDVAYFLSQSLPSDQRAASEEALVRQYHATLVSCGVDGVSYSFDDCWTDYRRAVLFVSCYPLNAGSVDLVNERAVELFRCMLGRSMAAIRDLGALEFLGRS